jgi:hypothetical protein
MANGLAADAIFLSGEVKGHIVGLENGGNWCGGGVEVGIPNQEGDVAEGEGMGVCVGAALTVLPG